MPVMTETPVLQQKKRFKMRLLDANFIEQYGGWHPKGSVIVVDEDTAIRWLENHIAEQAGRDEKTQKEIRRAELLATLEAVDEDEDEEPLPVRRGRPPGRVATPVRQPVGRPKQRMKATVAPELLGAGVLNSLDDVPEDDTEDDE
jgi:hypothetical protein